MAFFKPWHRYFPEPPPDPEKRLNEAFEYGFKKGPAIARDKWQEQSDEKRKKIADAFFDVAKEENKPIKLGNKYFDRHRGKAAAKLGIDPSELPSNETLRKILADKRIR